jgi:hypothetical protein
VRDTTMRVELDEARFSLRPSSTAAELYWDYVCERRVQLFPEAKLRKYVEFVHPGAELSEVQAAIPALSARSSRRRIELDSNGVTRYEIANGLRRAASVAVRARGVSPAFESIGLFSRYGGKTVTLSLSRQHAGELVPFGSETDLATGRERPCQVEALGDEWRLLVTDCPPRTLLRMYWPLPQ